MDTKILNQPSGSVAGQTLPNAVETVKAVVDEALAVLRIETKEYKSNVWCSVMNGNSIYIDIAMENGITASALRRIDERLKELHIRLFYIDTQANRVILQVVASTDEYTYDKSKVKRYNGDPFDESNAVYYDRD